ncbi:MAG: glucose sorbosone dehydrogenase [Candidatus Rokuibacteriota bacterium]|nr:MAG: glucose sorbosone dehydrogenase [Candidatus Rokubacteria bacterium]
MRTPARDCRVPTLTLNSMPVSAGARHLRSRTRLAPYVAAVAVMLVALVLLVRGQVTVDVVASRLEIPWALAFAADKRLFVTERPGRVRLVTVSGLQAKPVAVLPVTERGESGLLGLTLDPRFDENGYLYVCYTTSGRGDRLVNRVTRLTFRDGTAGHEVILLDGMPAAGNHDGCRLKFGSDGKLYITMGDAGEPALAQRLESPAGKILRLNAEGSVPTDNPFPGSPIYSLGHRNPQGLAWDRKGRLIAAEHGPVGHDEINHIRPGGNYGWPAVWGRAKDARYIDPILESGRDTWAPSGIAIRGDDLFVAALRGWLLRVTLGPDLEVTSVSTILAHKYGRLRDVVVGPDGALYVTTSNREGRAIPAPDDDRVLRVAP